LNEIHRRVFVRYPLGDAERCLDRYFRDFARGADEVTFAVRARVHLPTLQTDIVLQRDVVATIVRMPARASSLRCSIHWVPADGGPFPRFSGALAVGDGDGDETFSLSLDGRFEGSTEPPEDIAYRIVQATARDILARLCHDMEDSSSRVLLHRSARHARARDIP
jgi:hypothetical protein